MSPSDHPDDLQLPRDSGDSADEWQLLARMRSGDRDAFATLYRMLYEPIWRFAYLLVRSRESAQDITQDVFFNVWLQREVLDVQGTFRVYLYAAVRNRAWNVLRHQRVVATTETAVEHETIDPPAMGHSASRPDEAVEADEFSQAYRRALDAFSDRDRTVLLLRWEEDLTFAQIASILGLSAMGVRGIVLRAQEKLRSLLQQYRPPTGGAPPPGTEE